MCWVMNPYQLASPQQAQQAYQSNSLITQSQNILNQIISLSEAKNQDSFKLSIYNFVTFADMHSYCTFTMTYLCEKFGFQKRRLYDVINVFEAIGMCKKTTVDTVLWIGRFAIASKINKMKDKCQSASQDLIVSNEKCISISHLTTALINSFIINNSQIVDLKTVASLFSQGNNRFKTTLCKLYQISHILEAAKIVCKTESPGKIALSMHVFAPNPYTQHGVLDQAYITSKVSSPINSPKSPIPQPKHNISQSSKDPITQQKTKVSDLHLFDVESLLNKPMPLSPSPIAICA